MKIRSSLILFSIFITHEAKSCDIQKNLLICKQGAIETHICNESTKDTIISSLANKHTCSQPVEIKGRFTVKTSSLYSWISSPSDLSFSDGMESKQCESDSPSSLKCQNVIIHKCDEEKNNRIITSNQSQQYKCAPTRFIVRSPGEETKRSYGWTTFTPKQISASPPPSPDQSTALRLEEALSRLETAIQDTRRSLQRARH